MDAYFRLFEFRLWDRVVIRLSKASKRAEFHASLGFHEFHSISHSDSGSGSGSGEMDY